MKKNIAKYFALSLTFPMVLSSNVIAAEAQSKKVVVNTNRIQGKNRYNTAVNVCKTGWDKGSRFVIIASGENFADALCAVPLSKKYDAPILLTGKNSIDSSILDEINRLKPEQIFIMGGIGAISLEVQNKLSKLNLNMKMDRIEGKDRYQTAVKTAEKLGVSGKVIITSGENFADALSIATIAATKAYPIILTPKSNLPDSVLNFIKNSNINKSIIMGGEEVISQEISKSFKNSERIYGINRYETNKKVIQYFKNDINFEKIYYAVGGPDKTDFADALSGAALATKTNSPIILLDKKEYNSCDFKISEDILKSIKASQVIVLGGDKVVSSNFLESVKVSLQSNIDKVRNGQTSDGHIPAKDTINVPGENLSDSTDILSEINSASSCEVRKILLDNSAALGLNVSGYNSLERGRQKIIFKDFNENKPCSGFKSQDEVAKLFNNLVIIRTSIQTELAKVNDAVSAKSTETLEDLVFIKNVYNSIVSSTNVKSISETDVGIIKYEIEKNKGIFEAHKDTYLQKIIQKGPYAGYFEMLNAARY